MLQELKQVCEEMELNVIYDETIVDGSIYFEPTLGLVMAGDYVEREDIAVLTQLADVPRSASD
jgi:hypothetical protein